MVFPILLMSVDKKKHIVSGVKEMNEEEGGGAHR